MSSFDADVARALGAIGASPEDAAIDAFADPWGAVAALEATPARALLRVAPKLAEGGGGYGPEPRDPEWMLIERGSAAAKIIALRGEGARARTIGAIRIDGDEVTCCDAPACSVKKPRVALTLEIS